MDFISHKNINFIEKIIFILITIDVFLIYK
jgi:hypothetical protein